MAEPRGPAPAAVPASRLVDTNVLIVASAADAGSPFRPEGTPVDDAALRPALAALELGSACKLTNASDTDWLDCRAALRAVGLEVENLLNDWLVARWHTKHGKKARYD